ncbi:MAG: glycoside hydrolase family 38 C-terminal domain-containing protein, partial [Candidatus Hodarchaeales archaeon]
GYGNAANLPEAVGKLADEIENLVDQLQPFSPIPVYLLQYGTDHQFPNLIVTSALQQVQIEGMEISLGVLNDFSKKFQQTIDQENYTPPVFSGELRSGSRAHLLQDTYSARMWIKQWNQKVEDLLTHYAEPLNAYAWYYLKKEYPTSFLTQAWKWHLRNQPHDSICGCSVDQTHDEMRFRYSYAESITEGTVDEAIEALSATTESSTDNSLLVFNPTNCTDMPMYFEIKAPAKDFIRKLVTHDGREYEVQAIYSSSDKVWEMTVGTIRLKALMKMWSGPQIMNFFINEVSLFDGETPETCEVHLLVGDKPVGDLESGALKKDLLEKIDSKKYKKFHILVTREIEQTYATVVPLAPYAISCFTPSAEPITSHASKTLKFTKNSVSNEFFDIAFNKDGSFDLIDKINNVKYYKLHQFEDWGDRGDEYTFGRLMPEFIEVNDVKRVIAVSGSLFCEIEQRMTLSVFQEVDSTREKRIGKVKIPVKTNFRFYRDLSRIDIKTSLTNTAKDHRLRICFDLPFKSQYTFTSTHFGYIKRFGDPLGDETYIEKPSGIQPQKRFIRVEDENGQAAVTLMNQGLPEVELVSGTRLAITLIRSIGWLSRSDIPERPEHAGPFYATEGAQEFNKSYIFNYSFMAHLKEEPFFRSADHSEVFSLLPIASYLKYSIPRENILMPIIRIANPNIRISSLRVRNGKIYVSLFNMLSETINTQVQIPKTVKELIEIKIDGSEKGKIKTKNKMDLSFNPHEIKICTLE